MLHYLIIGRALDVSFIDISIPGKFVEAKVVGLETKPLELIYIYGHLLILHTAYVTNRGYGTSTSPIIMPSFISIHRSGRGKRDVLKWSYAGILKHKCQGIYFFIYY